MNKKLLKFVLILAVVAILPTMVFAAAIGDGCTDGLGGVLCRIYQILTKLVPVLIMLGVVYFIWGVIHFMIANSEEAKTKGKDQIIYGIIGLAVILGLFALVNIVTKTFGLQGQTLNAPALVAIDTTATSQSGCAVGNNPNLQKILGFGICIINNSIIPLIFAIAIVMFVWGAVKFFIIGADEESKREQGKQFMIWGVIALTVMTAVWGIVGIVGGTFGLKSNVLPQVCPPGSDQCKNSN